MAKQSDSIDANRMDQAEIATGVTDSVPQIEKFKLLVGKPYFLDAQASLAPTHVCL